jgi:hypothetical protein
MLRVHCFEETFVIKLRLEGTVSRDTYQQLESAIQAAIALLGARQLLIDVGSLTVGDESGVEVIRQLPTRGIELTAIPSAIESLFDTVAEQACREQCNRMQRLLWKMRSENLCRLTKYLTSTNALAKILRKAAIFRVVGPDRWAGRVHPDWDRDSRRCRGAAYGHLIPVMRAKCDQYLTGLPSCNSPISASRSLLSETVPLLRSTQRSSC